MPLKKLKQFLDDNNVKYVIISHSRAVTATEIAASAHIPGKDLAKTVMVKIDGKMTMVVLPSSYKIDFDQLKRVTNAVTVELASEEEFQDMFPECEVGAMPPFGNLYNMDVLVSKSLTEDEDIVFNAGSHKELIKLPYNDFAELVKPRILKFSEHY
jgi:Ala-tRNA(Pro) deacylase